MKAYRIPLVHHTIAPFNDPVSDTPILNQKLSEVQENCLKNLNITFVSSIPEHEPFLMISEKVWFTTELIERFIKQCKKENSSK